MTGRFRGFTMRRAPCTAILATTFRDTGPARVAGLWLSAIGAAFSFYLLVIQIAVIDAICQWCVASDIVMLLLLMASFARLRAAGSGRVGVASA